MDCRYVWISTQYIIFTGYIGKEEDEADMLRSILAQFEYSLRVKQHCSDGVPFDKYLHIPETHKLTGTVVCQREDEGHLFKVYSSSCSILIKILLIITENCYES